eukprot:3315908-Amphidinium_carterae.2
MASEDVGQLVVICGLASESFLLRHTRVSVGTYISGGRNEELYKKLKDHDWPTNTRCCCLMRTLHNALRSVLKCSVLFLSVESQVEATLRAHSVGLREQHGRVHGP